MKKKIITLFLVGILALSMAACAPADQQNLPLAGEENGTGEAANWTTEYGKITKLVGNKMTIDLAKSPEEEAPESEGDGEVAASISEPAQQAGDGGMGAAASRPENKMELEYTGESKEIMLPAGTTIVGLSGDEGKMTDLKEGSVVMMAVDEQGSVVSVIVLE